MVPIPGVGGWVLGTVLYGHNKHALRMTTTQTSSPSRLRKLMALVNTMVKPQLNHGAVNACAGSSWFCSARVINGCRLCMQFLAKLRTSFAYRAMGEPCSSANWNQ